MPEWLSKLMGNSVSLEEELINLRLTSKQMQRASKKCDKNEKEAVKKLKKVCVSLFYHSQQLVIYLLFVMCVLIMFS